MISHNHKCIFIHIPKCAGTSIEAALGHLDNHVGRRGQDHRSIRMIEKPYLTPKILRSKENFLEVIRRQKHQHFTRLNNQRNRLSVTQQQYESYFKFAIVRNPWARAFSWYQNVMSDPVHLKNFGITNELPFREFLMRFAGRGMLKPQLYWIKGFDGSIPLDYIGRFENLSEDVGEIFSLLNLKVKTIPHKIKSASEDYRSYYDEKTSTIIESLYKEEIEMFNYSFEK